LEHVVKLSAKTTGKGVKQRDLGQDRSKERREALTGNSTLIVIKKGDTRELHL